MEIVVFLDLKCDPKAPRITSNIFDEALRKTVNELKEFGLSGCIGSNDVVQPVIDSETSVKGNGTLFQRLDLAEMWIFAGNNSAILRLPINWSIISNIDDRRERLISAVKKIASEFGAGRFIMAPYPSESFVNKAYELAMSDSDFKKLEPALQKSKHAIEIKI